jgi:hypothetical protein
MTIPMDKITWLDDYVPSNQYNHNQPNFMDYVHQLYILNNENIVVNPKLLELKTILISRFLTKIPTLFYCYKPYIVSFIDHYDNVRQSVPNLNLGVDRSNHFWKTSNELKERLISQKYQGPGVFQFPFVVGYDDFNNKMASVLQSFMLYMPNWLFLVYPIEYWYTITYSLMMRQFLSNRNTFGIITFPIKESVRIPSNNDNVISPKDDRAFWAEDDSSEDERAFWAEDDSSEDEEEKEKNERDYTDNACILFPEIYREALKECENLTRYSHYNSPIFTIEKLECPNFHYALVKMRQSILLMSETNETVKEGKVKGILEDLIKYLQIRTNIGETKVNNRVIITITFPIGDEKMKYFQNFFAIRQHKLDAQNNQVTIALKYPIQVIITLPSIFDKVTPNNCTIIRPFDRIFSNILKLLASYESNDNSLIYNRPSFSINTYDEYNKLLQADSLNDKNGGGDMKFDKVNLFFLNSEEDVKKRLYFFIQNVIQCDVSRNGNTFIDNQTKVNQIAEFSTIRKFQSILQSYLKFFNDNVYVSKMSLETYKNIDNVNHKAIIKFSIRNEKMISLIVQRTTYNCTKKVNEDNSNDSSDDEEEEEESISSKNKTFYEKRVGMVDRFMIEKILVYNLGGI